MGCWNPEKNPASRVGIPTYCHWDVQFLHVFASSLDVGGSDLCHFSFEISGCKFFQREFHHVSRCHDLQVFLQGLLCVLLLWVEALRARK